MVRTFTLSVHIHNLEDSRCGAGHDRKIRAEQMKEISDFVKKENIP